MIVIGYQGIGKSTLAQKDFRYVDLESSALRQGDVRWHNWYEPYCMIAEWLSKQGYTVFVSSHKEVRDYLNEFCKEPFCAVVPSENLKEEWIDKLKKRFEQFPTDKNHRAYMNAVDRYTENVCEIKEDVGDVREITSMSYELDKLIDTADTPQMNKAKRKRYIKALENVLKSEEMSICHEAFLTEEAIKEILRILKEEKCQWTPCDERMPNEDGYYLVTLEFDYGKEIEMGWLLDGEWVNENSHATVAWMPLPKPYRG